MLKAITFDYWDTLYDGAVLAARREFRRAAFRELVDACGTPVSEAEMAAAHERASADFHRWWKEEHRGYSTEEAIRHLLAQLDVVRPERCELVTRAVEAVDHALLEFPPPLLAGAEPLLRALHGRVKLAIVSDTGIASGLAQDRVLERDGLRPLFDATVYSMDVGWAKPRPEPYRAALSALGVVPGEALHVGDNEHTDVAGALAVGMRAVRLDQVRESGASVAERVCRSLDELQEQLRAELG